MNPFSHALLFGMVFLLTLKELAEACSCSPSHPQQHFCSADIGKPCATKEYIEGLLSENCTHVNKPVIRAKVIRKEFVPAKNPDGQIKYGIKVIKMFKGFNKVKDMESVYTPIESSLCGVELDAPNKVEYLLTGYLHEGKVTISLCGMHTPWKDVSEFQMKSLSGTYQLGCGCRIIYCSLKLCDTRAKNECLWKDWVQEHTLDGKEALNNACIQGRDGSCTWYPGLPMKQPIYGSHP